MANLSLICTIFTTAAPPSMANWNVSSTMQWKRKIALVEIIPGKGSGQLKKRVLRFLEQPRIKQLYHRIEKDDKNFGRIFVHFRFK